MTAGGSAGLLVCALSMAAGACDAGRPASDPGGPLTLDASDVHVVGTSPAIADVRDLEVLPDGTVWVLNSIEPYFIGFGPDGGELGAYGDAGGGPDELGLPSAFVTGGVDGEAWVLDLRRHAFVEVAGSGEPVVAHPLPRATLPPGSVAGGMDILSNEVRTDRLGDQILLPRISRSLADGVYDLRLAMVRPDLVALDPETDGTHVVVALGEALGDPARGFERSEGGFPLWFSLWAVCDGEIRVFDRNRNVVAGFDAMGDTLPSLPLPPAPFTEATPRQFARVMFDLVAAEAAGQVGTKPTAEDSTRLMSSMLQRIHSPPEQLAAYLPYYVDMRCAADGTVWLRPFDLEAGGLRGTRTWLRIDGEGGARPVELPARFDPYRFTGGRIWGVQRDELDVASVAWIEAPGKP